MEDLSNRFLIRFWNDSTCVRKCFQRFCFFEYFVGKEMSEII